MMNEKVNKTYLGPKGYILLKKDLSEQKILEIKKELTAKPFVPGASINTSSTYSVYRESANQLFVPRYYGEAKFGKPDTLLIGQGDPIDINFVGDLRENQMPVVEAYLSHLSEGQGGGLLELPCAYGKTVLSLYLIAKLKKKTLIIVHKEFLMNQWIERIQQFLPGAHVGKIQGSNVDIDGKDIVLGMLQSLSMKDYDARLFSSFGLTVIDEVHHISSEVFSCALFKIVTACTLGLSATMNRKDGTTYIFKQFLGDIVYKGTREEGDHAVVVRAITYKTKDEEFNEIKRDYRGDVQYSSMISKLCMFAPRNEFVLDILRDLWTERPGMQIMVLAHNRNVLTYLHDAIVTRGIAEGSAGYYVGGMKEKDLKTTESKHIVIATYSMAQEALDIRTLTTLVMVTPKTDIEQAVGRILRVKHGSPLVVDIVDTHAPFQNQWRKRRQFYKKQNYKIVSYKGFSCFGDAMGEGDDVVSGGSCLLPLSLLKKKI